MAAARRRGLDMSRLRARQIVSEDFARFDFILAMDHANLSDLRRRAPTQYRQRIRLFLEFAPDLGIDEVPDPYYGGAAGFEDVLDLAEQAARGLLSHLRDRS
jgi:protein-tyrosine phosphatase